MGGGQNEIVWIIGGGQVSMCKACGNLGGSKGIARHDTCDSTVRVIGPLLVLVGGVFVICVARG